MFTGKEEEEIHENPHTNLKLKASTTTITSWSRSRSKDPRIVRVSRAFGSKDRHSKVCTVKGLRDRRVRLSIPTAIQLYDLQERLNLSQPSKVVDWLLDAAKKDIEELPPLQIPQEMCWDKHKDEVFEKWPNFFCENRGNPSSDQVQMSGSMNGYNPFLKWDSFNLSQKAHAQSQTLEDLHGCSVVQLQPSLVYQPLFAQQMSTGFDSGGGPIHFTSEGNNSRFQTWKLQ